MHPRHTCGDCNMGEDPAAWVTGDDGDEDLPYGDHGCIGRDGIYRQYLETPTDLKYTCDQCGACCRQWLVEITLADVLREPRFLDRDGLTLADMELRHVEGLRNKPAVKKACEELGVPDLGDVHVLTIASGEEHPCLFLGADNRCGCHATKPAVCAEFEAGWRQCQEARYNEGLPALAPDA